MNHPQLSTGAAPAPSPVASRWSVQLANNESALGPSPRAMAAAAGVLGARYPDPDARRLREAVARLHDRTPEEVCATAGASEAIQLLVRAFAGEVILPTGSFPLYARAAASAGRAVRYVPRDADHRVDLAAISAAIGPDSRLIFLACPDNPTGTTPDGLRAWLGSLPDTVIPVVDLAYAGFADPPDLAFAHPNLVLLYSMSKAYGLASLRVGYAVAAPRLIAQLDAVRDPFNVSGPGEAAAVAALLDARWLAEVRRYTALAQSSLEAELRRRGLSPVPSGANFVFIPGARGLADDLAARGVQVRRLDGWGYPDAVRVTVGRPEEHAALFAALDGWATD